MIFQSYLEQTARWPRSGRHILAQFDADSIIVYQAYNEPIGHFAAQNGRFGGDFSFTKTRSGCPAACGGEERAQQRSC